MYAFCIKVTHARKERVKRHIARYGTHLSLSGLRASRAHRDTGSVRAEVTVAEVAKPGHYVLALVEDLRVGVRRVRVGSEN